MKVNCLWAAILSLSLPISVFGMGMGEIRVHSFLNQPFNAEIPLTDTEGVSLDTIRVNLASVEEYSRIGLTSNEILSFLRFTVKRDQNGQPVIAITSTERISDPYLQIVVDLAWPAGQIYRAYTILLDPPGYQIKKPNSITVIKKANVNKTSIGEPGVINQPVYQHMSGKVSAVTQEATYGPTLANESIWQIAQRYKTADTTLPQVVLAIVGANLDAFTQGNLNGLKVGEQLKIPSSEQIAQIPIRLAIEEVAAHDLAWQNKQEIKHIIFPPYINKTAKTSKLSELDTTYYESKIAPIPKFNLETPGLNSAATSLPAPEVFFTASNTIPSITQEQSKNLDSQTSDVTISAGLGVTLAAIDTVRTENSLIKDQLEKLKAANNRLQQQVSKQQKEMAVLQEQLRIIVQERQALRAQTSSLNSSDSPSWLYWLIIGGSSIVILYGLLYWFWLKQREEDDELNESSETVIIPPTVNNPTAMPEGDKTDANAESTKLDKSTESTKNPAVVEPMTIQAMQIESAAPTNDKEVAQTTRIKTEEEHIGNTKDETFDINQNDLTAKTEQPNDKSANSSTNSVNRPDRVESDKYQPMNDETTAKQPPNLEDETAKADSTKTIGIEEVNNSMMAAKSSDTNVVENVAPSVENKNSEENDSLSDELESELNPDNLIPFDKPLDDIKQPKDSLKQFKQNKEEDSAVDFEPGLDKLIKPKSKQNIRDEQSLDFVIDDQVEALLKHINHNPDASSVKAETSIPLATDTSLNSTNENLSDSGEQTSNTEQIETIDQEKHAVNSTESVNTDNSPSESQLVKSQTALNTLLSLAETYIAMEDFESAGQSLEEVIKFGNDEQKAQAQKLLQKLSK
ncbi:FimV/HubP family polar landmark protein [Legionella sp. CNM-1927-20]|uniref:FimV/HubP family polar landmark protein n=1 Tax=Legionella sp. CNM-1927-20 TaxID=3422221 RepID=UPI00403ABA6A